ncbi:DUF512 domain-containing protein [Eubacteriales bacterium OttesenSCG-928-M02]|nr:DUF512 domain-containing protein [Eubacteriales bacterium OttesenSCG-928-M02]
MQYQTIVEIEENSIAEELGIQVGHRLLCVDDVPIRDVLDYRARLEEDYLELLLEAPNGEQTLYQVEKEPGEDLGLTFSSQLMAPQQACQNKCIFCFVDQLPKNVRPTLRFKDDDFRLSFLMGNYVTLTNVPDMDWQRILSQRISPLYVSVHTTDGALRKEIMGNHMAGDIRSRLSQLAACNMGFHVQIVLMKGVNDGEALQKTLGDLRALLPHVLSVAIVPVGLTDHREGLYPLLPLTKEDALSALALAKDANQGLPAPLVFCADELYLLAGRPIPSAGHYGQFHQLEDGIGMLRHFLSGVEDGLSHIPPGPGYTATFATGKAAFSTMADVVGRVNEATGSAIRPLALQNSFFGSRITVAGLLTGQDFLSLKGQILGDCLYIPAASLREDAVFLDDMSLQALQHKLGVPVIPLPNDGYEFVRILITTPWRDAS